VTGPDVVLRILQDAGRALSPADIRIALQDKGMSETEAETAWLAARAPIKAHEQVSVEGSRYRWLEPPDVTPAQALDLLLDDVLPSPRRNALAKLIREALTDSQEAARRRQAEIDGVRMLAELASEVEELIVNETEPPVMIRQVRAWVKRSGLDPVGEAGETTRFDRTKHRAIAGRIRDGASVIVVRPGYVWARGSENVLLGKAVVEE
jgi:hypothetical protein